jgi:hypothetical protein
VLILIAFSFYLIFNLKMSINYLHGNPVKAGYLESKKNHGKRGEG